MSSNDEEPILKYPLAVASDDEEPILKYQRRGEAIEVLHRR